MARSLDLVVTSVATELMDATASTATEVSKKVLAQLVEQFDVDASFLRHHDHDIRAWVLVAEWPPRTDIPDPDPIAVVHFTSADPVLAQCERDRKPVVVGPDQPARSLCRWTRAGTCAGFAPICNSLMPITRVCARPSSSSMSTCAATVSDTWSG